MNSKTTINFLFGFSLIFCTLNFSIECCSSDSYLVEFNEEIQQILEDDFPIEAIFLDLDPRQSIPEFFVSKYSKKKSENDYKSNHFYEVDSPPPELT